MPVRNRWKGADRLLPIVNVFLLEKSARRAGFVFWVIKPKASARLVQNFTERAGSNDEDCERAEEEPPLKYDPGVGVSNA